MAFNFVAAVREQMGFGSFDKIDPNNQQGKKELTQSYSADHFAQAATIAVLLGLYKYGETEQGSVDLLHQPSGDMLPKIFGKEENELIKTVSNYGNKSFDDTKLFMTNIAKNSVDILHKQIGDNATIENVRTFFAGQRHNILVYLPSDLNIGEQLRDESVEDRTNKMEGPVSNLMHKIEDLFSARENKD
ncbi:MAG: hypothetical protein ACR2FN_05505 [Chitinophagaceae bacterium]